jgi:hypothetical protein
MPIVPSTAALRAARPVALRLDKPPPSTTAFVDDARGGAIAGNVVAFASGNEHFSRKQLDRVVYEDIAIEVGSSMPAALFDWIATSWGAKPTARDGAILGCDSTFTVRRERGFQGGYISETAFPAFDAASKSPGRLTVRITPAAILPDVDPGTKLQSTIGKGVSKLWLVPNFRLEISGLDCTRVSRIEPFAVRRPIERAQSGRGGRPSLQPGRIDFPNLRITFAAISAKSWWDWHASFVVGGSNADADERAGSISLLAPNLSTELARIELAGLGIFRLSTDPPDDSPSAIQRVTADLYCERMTLKPGSAP